MSKQDSEHAGKAAIITGSATGIGAAAAEALARRGVNVAINYSKSADEAEATGERCRALGVEAIVVQADVTDDAACKALAKAAEDAWGRIDILVNNAGGTKHVKHDDLDGLDADDFLWIYKLNVISAFQMIRAVAPAMKRQGRGSVVNTSSIAAVAGIGSSVAYAASKGALNTMTLSLARALAPEIRVNAVCPGYVGTRWFKDRMDEEAFEKQRAYMEQTTPLKAAGTPEGVAQAIEFFALDGPDWITGETLMTDAGMHLNFTPLAAR
ncbi:MAG: SDR family oxidoreductase [Maricaulaceae bacterium]|jgi:3-oxoacyl-[acyl-carrier protein] reductase